MKYLIPICLSFLLLIVLWVQPETDNTSMAVVNIESTPTVSEPNSVAPETGDTDRQPIAVEASVPSSEVLDNSENGKRLAPWWEDQEILAQFNSEFLEYSASHPNSWADVNVLDEILQGPGVLLEKHPPTMEDFAGLSIQEGYGLVPYLGDSAYTRLHGPNLEVFDQGDLRQKDSFAERILDSPLSWESEYAYTALTYNNPQGELSNDASKILADIRINHLRKIAGVKSELILLGNTMRGYVASNYPGKIGAGFFRPNDVPSGIHYRHDELTSMIALIEQDYLRQLNQFINGQ